MVNNPGCWGKGTPRVLRRRPAPSQQKTQPVPCLARILGILFGPFARTDPLVLACGLGERGRRGVGKVAGGPSGASSCVSTSVVGVRVDIERRYPPRKHTRAPASKAHQSARHKPAMALESHTGRSPFAAEALERSGSDQASLGAGGGCTPRLPPRCLPLAAAASRRRRLLLPPNTCNLPSRSADTLLPGLLRQPLLVMHVAPVQRRRRKLAGGCWPVFWASCSAASC